MNQAYSITSKGQVTLPKALRDAVGIATAHRVTFYRRG
ncbi:MAG: AbrB/MazE/SpoVT family DNA-binding domain-containing protein [Candidatus Saccharimonadales bacterium]